MNRDRRRVLRVAGAFMACAVTGARASAATAIEVWKDPNCGCCGEWVKHLEVSGFSVRVNDTGNSAARARLKVPQALASCHTAQVEGYAIEGHVPAADIRRLLAQKPVAIGLAVPGMPVGSPGMEDGARRDPYDVLLVMPSGGTRVFQSHR